MVPLGLGERRPSGGRCPQERQHRAIAVVPEVIAVSVEVFPEGLAVSGCRRLDPMRHGGGRDTADDLRHEIEWGGGKIETNVNRQHPLRPEAREQARLEQRGFS